MRELARNIAILMVKDVRLLSKDRGTLAVLFLLPLLFSLIIGAPLQMADSMSGKTEPDVAGPAIATLLVNEDAGPYGAEIADAVEGVGLLHVLRVADRATADESVASGDVPAAVVIPPGFSNDVNGGRPTTIQVIADPTQRELAEIVTSVVTQAASEATIIGEIRLGVRSVIEETGILAESTNEFRLAAEAQTVGVIWSRVVEARQSPLITVTSESLDGDAAGEGWNVFSYYAPSFGVMFAFFLTAFMASALLLERERGTLARLLASPIRASAVVGGKIAAYGVVVFLQIIVMFGVGAIAFGMPMGTSPIGLLLTTLGLALAATSLGVMIGALAKSSDSAGNIGTLLAFILMAAGGCLFPIFRAGGIVSVISYLTPHAHALTAYMGLMADDLRIGDVWFHIAALFGFAALFFVISVTRTRTPG